MGTHYGKWSCGIFATVLLCLAGVVGSYLYTKFAPPSGAGEFRGMNHLGAFFLLILFSGLALLLSLPGLLLGVAGLKRDRSQDLALAGTFLNGIVLFGLVIGAI